MVVFKNSDEIENLSSNELQYLSKNNDLSKEVNLKGNIENFIGWTMVPTGIAGPLRINGKFANGLFQIPLATTEGALVASYNRGAKTITASGGATTLITKEGIQRSPSFKFKSLVEVEIFIHWITDQFHQFQYKFLFIVSRSIASIDSTKSNLIFLTDAFLISSKFLSNNCL